MFDYHATLARVVDGDTVYLTVDLGFRLSATFDFRLLGINAPEMNGSTRAAGEVAKAELDRLLKLGTLRITSAKSDKYGRWLATIYVKQLSGIELNVNDAMLKAGFAVVYSG